MSLTIVISYTVEIDVGAMDVDTHVGFRGRHRVGPPNMRHDLHGLASFDRTTGIMSRRCLLQRELISKVIYHKI